MKKLKNFIAVNVVREAGDNGTYKEVKIKVPSEYDVITGIAVFVENQPEEIKDFKVSIRETKQQHFDLISKKLFESNSTVAPNEKFAKVDIPTGKSLDLFLGVELPVAVPAENELKFQLICEVMDLQD